MVIRRILRYLLADKYFVKISEQFSLVNYLKVTLKFKGGFFFLFKGLFFLNLWFVLIQYFTKIDL